MIEPVRSPNYPRFSLPRCIFRLKKYRLRIDCEICDEAEIARRLGFSGVTGASVPVLSSLKKFGLLDVLPDGFRFSQAAQSVIDLSEEDSQYAGLIEEIAFTPELYQEIRAEFGKQFPDTGEFRDFLLTRGFVPKTVAVVIDIYRETYEAVASVSDDYQSVGTSQSAKKINDPKKHRQTETAAQEWLFNLAEGIEVSIKFSGIPEKSAVLKLADFWKYIETYRESGGE